jgi:hypothetical protein
MGFMGPPDAIEHPSWLWTPGRPECLALQASASVVGDQFFIGEMVRLADSWHFNRPWNKSPFFDRWIPIICSPFLLMADFSLLKIGQIHRYPTNSCQDAFHGQPWVSTSLILPFILLLSTFWMGLNTRARGIKPMILPLMIFIDLFALLQIFCHCKNLTFRPSVWAEHGFTGHPAGQVDLFAVCGTWALPKQFLKKNGRSMAFLS